MCIYRYPATVCDGVCLDVLSCLLGIIFFFIGMVLLKLKVLLCAGKNPQPLNFSVLLVVCVCGYLLIPLLGSFYEILKMLRGWEGGVPLTLDGESMLL